MLDMMGFTSQKSVAVIVKEINGWPFLVFSTFSSSGENGSFLLEVKKLIYAIDKSRVLGKW